MNKPFDAEAFYSALDAQRISLKKNWKQVSKETGVAASTLTRMGQGRSPDANGLASLASWSGLDVKSFYRVTGQEVDEPEPLAKITTILRADRNLSKEGIGALETMLKSAYDQMRKSDG